MIRKAIERQGIVPGTVITTDNHPIIRCFDYDSENVSEKELRLVEIPDLLAPKGVRVLMFNNYRNADLLSILKVKYNIHSLSAEDISHTEQRSKYDSYDSYELCIINKYVREDRITTKKQISIVLTSDTVLLFVEGHEQEPNIEFVLKRIREKKGRIRERDAGYAAYAFLDSVVDSYLVLLEEIEGEMEQLDSKISMELNNPNVVKEVFALKKVVLNLKKNTWPLREMINSIIRDEKSKFYNDEKNRPFLRDLQDHVMHFTESVDGLRDSMYSLVEMHTNFMGMKMNEIMKVLTVITTIFAPVMFLASIYGMNFDGIPELHVPHGYILFWGVVVISSVSQFIYFRKKGWI